MILCIAVNILLGMKVESRIAFNQFIGGFSSPKGSQAQELSFLPTMYAA